MFNSPKMRKAMVVVMLFELLILLGLLVNDHIQAENRFRQQVHALAAQVAALTQEQQTTATELKTTQAQVKVLSEENAVLKNDVQTLKKSCADKSPCCKKKPKCKEKCKEKSKCKSDCGDSNCKRCPSKDKPGNGDQPTKKPECGNNKGTTSPPLHQVEMYYGAVKTVISVPAR